jgi:DNA-binding CsgD family transcriptional regulator/tetratricopeptide (TPR) repeat protein
MSDQRGSGWPFVGREGQLRAVRGALESGAGMMIAGAAGVGKSRLAAHTLAGLDGYAVVRALGTETAAMIPFGAFAHVLTGPPEGGENLLRWAARHLRDSAGDGELLVTVDDAHRLDPASATLVHYLAQSGTARLLVTVRGGEQQPPPVAALWKDELLDRIELPPLTVEEVGLVLAGALGGEVSPDTVRHLARVSEGNVLYLRELVHAGRTGGCLTEADGRWRWSGELSMTTRLRELVGARIGHLDHEEREVLELVAFGEPVGAELVVGLTSAQALERVEGRGLVATVADGSREHLRLGHPLYGEVVRGDCGTLRSRRRLRMLAEALEASGLRRRDDELKAAVWRLDSGSITSPAVLLSAANLAWARQDPRLAARLARAAADAGAGVAAVALLGQALMVLGDAGTALTELRQTAPAATESERAQHAISMGLNHAWAGEHDEARQWLGEAARTLTDPAWRQEAHIYLGVVEFWSGRVTNAWNSLERARACTPITVRGAAHLAALDAWASAYSGRTGHALEVIEEALAAVDVWGDETPHALPTMLDARCAALVFSGQLDELERTADYGMELAAAELSVSGFGAFRAVAGRLRGDVAGAARWSRDDAARLHDRSPYRGRCLAEQAHALALLGRTAQARELLPEAEELASLWAFTVQPVLQAGVWVAASSGDLDEAVRLCRSSAEVAERNGQAGHLMFALHDLVRLGAAEQAVHELSALADAMDGRLVRLCARHARAHSRMGDATELRAVAEEFERMGLILYAAEATAQEAAAHLASGRGTLAKGAQTRAWALARRCPGVMTPALVELATPGLTPRQREIVQLAAAGLTNRQIADRLTVSTRTAANHLQAVYDKLGVNDRAEVGRLLASF